MMRTAGTLHTFARFGALTRWVDLHFLAVAPDGIRSSLVFALSNVVNENEVEPQPTLSMRQDEAQQLMDELWRVGLRPSEGTGSAGAMAAVQAHLADMRALVFKGEK
jgi:hypothetical protein